MLVLILVVVEIGLGVFDIFIRNHLRFFVLILVVVEIGLGDPTKNPEQMVRDLS